jgi:hypothetical protein
LDAILLRSEWRRGEALPFLALAAPCGVRAAVVNALEKQRVRWVEAFTGGGVMAVAATASASLRVAVLGRSLAPPAPATSVRNSAFRLCLPARSSCPRACLTRLARALREFASGVRQILASRGR